MDLNINWDSLIINNNGFNKALPHIITAVLFLIVILIVSVIRSSTKAEYSARSNIKLFSYPLYIVAMPAIIISFMCATVYLANPEETIIEFEYKNEEGFRLEDKVNFEQIGKDKYAFKKRFEEGVNKEEIEDEIKKSINDVKTGNYNNNSSGFWSTFWFFQYVFK